ncbi:hypothetical protein P171DRAFT_436864 [Karstenula rhodostoma CBS 690.94]|uniref:Tat pathway signal sequence n=1 Tax=Karstenula rhodostoma CBS 690.94 TaxID=1392251 RepID=A0A9P4P6M7_9PLEO|nr:hypothetical protein P171DRAFT_436864 [Karstenula rhodostoma CBS 690.94]
MWKTLYKPLPKNDFDSNEPLSKDDLPLEQVTTEPNRISRCLPSLQQTFNVVAIVYVVLSLPTVFSFLRNQRAQVYSPVNPLITYERQPLHEDHEVLEHKGFVGHPNDTESHWRDLLEPMNFKATEEELRKANINIDDKVVRVSGGGYVGVLSVYHELHCLEALRRSTLRSHYYPGMTDAGLDHDDRVLEHLTHCIEYVRRTIMCHADVSVYTAVWIADSHEKPNKDLISGGERECVSWDAIDKWSRSRALQKKVYKVKPGPFEKALHPSESDVL